MRRRPSRGSKQCLCRWRFCISVIALRFVFPPFWFFFFGPSVQPTPSPRDGVGRKIATTDTLLGSSSQPHWPGGSRNQTWHSAIAVWCRIQTSVASQADCLTGLPALNSQQARPGSSCLVPPHPFHSMRCHARPCQKMPTESLPGSPPKLVVADTKGPRAQMAQQPCFFFLPFLTQCPQVSVVEGGETRKSSRSPWTVARGNREMFAAPDLHGMWALG